MKAVCLPILAAAGLTAIVTFAAPAEAHAGTATCLSSGLTRISNDDPHSGVVTLNDGRHLTLPASGHVDFTGPPATTFSIVWSDQFSQGSRNLPTNCHPPTTTTTTTAPSTTTTVKATTTTGATTSTTVQSSTSLVTSTTAPSSSVVSTTADQTTTSSSSSTLPANVSIQPLVTLGNPVTVVAPETAVLPVTGFPAGLVAVVAVVAILAGYVIVVSARRRASKSGQS